MQLNGVHFPRHWPERAKAPLALAVSGTWWPPWPRPAPRRQSCQAEPSPHADRARQSRRPARRRLRPAEANLASIPEPSNERSRPRGVSAAPDGFRSGAETRLDGRRARSTPAVVGQRHGSHRPREREAWAPTCRRWRGGTGAGGEGCKRRRCRSRASGRRRRGGVDRAKIARRSVG